MCHKNSFLTIRSHIRDFSEIGTGVVPVRLDNIWCFPHYWDFSLQLKELLIWFELLNSEGFHHPASTPPLPLPQLDPTRDYWELRRTHELSAFSCPPSQLSPGSTVVTFKNIKIKNQIRSSKGIRKRANVRLKGHNTFIPRQYCQLSLWHLIWYEFSK